MNSSRAAGPPVNRFRLHDALAQGVWAGVTVNAVGAALFWNADLVALAWLCTGSTALFLFSLKLIEWRYLGWVSGILFGELLVHVPVVVLMVGWDSGFQYYLLAIAPVMLIGGPKYARFTGPLAFVFGAMFLGLDHLSQHVAPLVAADSPALSIIRSVNIVAAFLLATYIPWRFGQQRLQTERKLAEAANTDPLTGLANRRHINTLALREVSRCQRTGTPLSVVVVDIDSFKSVNDRYGHDAGDAVLVAVAQHLVDAIRSEDLVARWGGEEFLLVLPGTPWDRAERVAERVRQTLEHQGVPVADDTSPITATFGVAQHLPDEAFERCVSRADAALYQGKRAGRNQVVVDQSVPIRTGTGSGAGHSAGGGLP